MERCPTLLARTRTDAGLENNTSFYTGPSLCGQLMFAHGLGKQGRMESEIPSFMAFLASPSPFLYGSRMLCISRVVDQNGFRLRFVSIQRNLAVISTYSARLRPSCLLSQRLLLSPLLLADLPYTFCGTFGRSWEGRQEVPEMGCNLSLLKCSLPLPMSQLYLSSFIQFHRPLSVPKALSRLISMTINATLA
jgi:hypothetical protein